MNKEKSKMIASIVKDKRNRLNYTQQELADLSNISLRSIQRIEKGEVMPRMHTLKVLANALNFSLDFLDDRETPELKSNTLARKIILSLLIVLSVLLLSASFFAQSSSFPETNFEVFVYCMAMLLVISFALLRLWNKNNTQDKTNKNE